ncbi:Rieske 2Fe-2S domain-containing protein [Aquibium sp. LZ166]|uniref:Rieske 2Fe-2S domain-containing protein n=1 Tax=Aquibium pacificus TaxID=3153579 RepID=A0ABV3SEY6_9HYPH
MNKQMSGVSLKGEAISNSLAGLDSFADLASDARVHSGIYTRPDVFEAEMERVFYKTWVYIGHESEVPKEGEFKLRQIGRQPVILVRGSNGQVNVLLNRCRHRGAVVAEVESGKTKFFRCWYHGWTYDTDGKLVQVTGADAYEDGFCEKVGGLARPPRVENYRGFVFASLAEEGIGLREHLGKAAEMLDYLIDASPTGKIRLDAGVHKTTYRGNWKLVGMDGYHVYYVHASVIAVWHAKADSGAGATHRHDPYDDKSLSVTRDLGNGHCMLDLRKHRLKHVDEYLAFLERSPGGSEYIASMYEKHGKERGRELLSLAGDPHVGIFPNMQIINNQVRIMNPISANETEILMFPVLFEGVPDEINSMRLRQHESFYGPAGAGSPDDAEIFERTQRGMHAQVEPWIDISRGLNRERIDEDGTTIGLISDEVTQRAQVREWRRLMDAG